MRVTSHNFQDRNDPCEGVRISDAEALLRTLEEMHGRDPFILELEGENGFRLTVGIGGSACCIQFASTSGDPPYLVATANGDDAETFDQDHVFMCGGQATDVAAERCVSFETLKYFELYFLRTGERSPDMTSNVV